MKDIVKAVTDSPSVYLADFVDFVNAMTSLIKQLSYATHGKVFGRDQAQISELEFVDQVQKIKATWTNLKECNQMIRQIDIAKKIRY